MEVEEQRAKKNLILPPRLHADDDLTRTYDMQVPVAKYRNLASYLPLADGCPRELCASVHRHAVASPAALARAILLAICH